MQEATIVQLNEMGKTEVSILKLERREKRKPKEFGIWLNSIMIVYGIKAASLASSIGVDPAYISRIKNYNQEASENVERLITSYFEKKNIEVYTAPKEQAKIQDLNTWIKNTLMNNCVTEKKFYTEIGMKYSKSSNIKKRKKMYVTKYVILMRLRDKYGVDVSEGMEMLHEEVAMYEELRKWIKCQLEKANIPELSFIQELYDAENYEHTSFYYKEWLSTYAFESITKIFKEYGVTMEAKKLMMMFDPNKNRYKDFADWLYLALRQSKLNGVEVANHINCSRGNVYHYLQGKSIPSKKFANKLFNLLDSKNVDTDIGRQILKRLKDERK